jgi:hypothetical protein
MYHYASLSLYKTYTIINLAMVSSERPRTVQYNITDDGISSSIRGFSH